MLQSTEAPALATGAATIALAPAFLASYSTQTDNFITAVTNLPPAGSAPGNTDTTVTTLGELPLLPRHKCKVPLNLHFGDIYHHCGRWSSHPIKHNRSAEYAPFSILVRGFSLQEGMSCSRDSVHLLSSEHMHLQRVNRDVMLLLTRPSAQMPTVAVTVVAALQGVLWLPLACRWTGDRGPIPKPGSSHPMLAPSAASTTVKQLTSQPWLASKTASTRKAPKHSYLFSVPLTAKKDSSTGLSEKEHQTVCGLTHAILPRAQRRICKL